MSINIPNPNKGLLKALAEAGYVYEPTGKATEKPKSKAGAARPRRRRKRCTTSVRIPVQGEDPFWPLVVVMLGCILAFCLML